MRTPTYTDPGGYHTKRLPYAQKAIEFIKKRTNYNGRMKIVDIACGTGLLLENFQDASQIIGIDLSIEMLDFCRKRYALNVAPNFIQCDAHCISLPANYTDLLLVGHAIHWFDLESFLCEANRILKPGGWLVIISRYPSPKEPFRPLYLYILHKWAQKNTKPKLLEVKDVGVGYISHLEQFGFRNYQRTVFEETVCTDINEYIRLGDDHLLYLQMSSQLQKSYKADLKEELQKLTSNKSISELNYDYVSVAQKLDDVVQRENTI